MDCMTCAIRMSPPKQCGSDLLPTWLKEITSTLTLYVTKLFNLKLAKGHFLLLWKHTIVTHLLNKTRMDESKHGQLQTCIDFIAYVKDC